MDGAITSERFHLDMPGYILATILCLLCGWLAGCREQANQQQEKQAILDVIESIQRAHLDKDAEAFYRHYADQWIDVRHGYIDTAKRFKSVERTQAYLDAMTFLELKFLQPPTVEMSDDGTLADFIGAILMRGYYKDQPMYWTASWQNTLKRDNADWQIISAVNTDGDKVYNAQVFLNEMRKRRGLADSLLSIRALADCEGPGYAFRTLILSTKGQGRMEQMTPRAHYILKHGQESSWSVDLKRNEIVDSLDAMYRIFVKGHELHWIAFSPETRYTEPVLAEATKFKDQWAFPILLKDDLGNPVFVYYDFESYTPLGLTIHTDDQGNTVTVLFEDWEKHQSVSLFTKAIFQQGDEAFIYRFTHLSTNDPETEELVHAQEPEL